MKAYPTESCPQMLGPWLWLAAQQLFPYTHSETSQQQLLSCLKVFPEPADKGRLVPGTAHATSSLCTATLCKIDGNAQEKWLQLTSDVLTNQLAQHPDTAPLSLVSKTWGWWALESTECPLLSPPHGHILGWRA